MARKTGNPRGRPKGAKNHHTIMRERRIEEAAALVESRMPKAFRGDSHAFLMSVYKNEENDIAVRLDAAKAAIGYEKPRLATTALTVDDKRSPDQYTDVELERLLAASSAGASEAAEGESESHGIH